MRLGRAVEAAGHFTIGHVEFGIIFYLRSNSVYVSHIILSFSALWRCLGCQFGPVVPSESVGSSRSWLLDIHETICVKKRQQAFDDVHYE